MRTTPQRTTLPFLMAESGAASFTAAVTTSPRPARRPRSPPRGRIQESLRAPELSATSRIVRIPIIISSCPLPRGRGSPKKLNLHVEIRGLGRHLDGFPHDVRQPPALQLAQRPALDDAHDVAHLGAAFFVV